MRKIAECVPEGSTRNRAIELFTRAKELVKLGPLAFGEDHNSPVARAIIWDLMDIDLIRMLFTEQPNPKLGAEEISLEERFQTLARPDLKDGQISFRGGGTESSLSGPIEGYYERAERLNETEGGRSKPVIPYMDLMQHAVQRGVLVYCYDIKVNAQRDSEGYRRPKALEKAKVVNLRDDHMAMRYLATPNVTQGGTVLLGGSDHFDDSYPPSLLKRMGIPKEQYLHCC